MRQIRLSTRTIDVLACFSTVVVCVLLYRKITRLSWMWDDPLHLNLARANGFEALAFGRRFWRAYPAHVYAPLQLVSPKFDLTLFGANATAFYVHQLIAVSLCGVLLYLAMRCVADPLTAFATAVLAVAGPAFAQTVPQLMTRQYFEGLILAIVATWAFVRDRPSLSAIFYFASTLAKEVFVPLPILLLAMYPKRWRQLIPHGGALVCYAVLRIVILGPRLQAYGYTVRTSEWPMTIATAPLRIFRAFAGDAGVIGSCLVIATLLFLIVLFVREPKYRIVILVGAAAVILPILPVSIDMQSRFVLVAWVLAAVGAGLALKRYTVALLLLALVANRIQWGRTMRDSMRMSDEARTFASMSAGNLLWMPLMPPGTLLELRTFTGSRGRWLYDQQPVCAKRVSADRVLGYDASSRVVRDVSHVELGAQCSSIRTAPLSVELDGARDSVFWNFGPYSTGTYRIILGDGLQGFDVPAHIGFRLPVNSLGFRVRYDSPEGWGTYSPDLTVDVADSQRVLWHR